MASANAKHIDTTLEVLKAINEARPGTTIAHAEVFLTLVQLAGDAEKPVLQEDISNILGRSQGVVAKQLAKFRDAGLIDKEFAPNSELIKQYPLTPKGKALLHRIRKILNQ